MDELFTLQTMEWRDAMLRVGLAFAFGLVFGFERRRKNKPVDYRVYMIVGVMTCLLAIMSREIYEFYAEHNMAGGMDMMRVIEGVLVGIGFLGTGAIIKESGHPGIIGMATGASIWASGIIGLMLGFGFYGLAGLGFVMIALILVLFGLLRKPLFDTSDTIEDEGAG